MSYEDIDMNAHLILSLPDGSEIPMDRFNTVLVTFIGRQVLSNGEVIDNSRFNHVAVGVEDESGLTMDETDFAVRIFKMSDCYEPLKQFITANRFPMWANETRVSPDVREAYDRCVIADAGEAPDFIPDEWRADGAA